MRPGQAVVPFASTTTSHCSISSALTLPTFEKRPSAIMIASPSTKGLRQSPLTIVPILTMAIRITQLLPSLAQSVLADDFIDAVTADPVIEAATAGEHTGDRQFIRHRSIRHHERHRVVMRPNSQCILVRKRYVDDRIRPAALRHMANPRFAT